MDVILSTVLTAALTFQIDPSGTLTPTILQPHWNLESILF